MLIPLLVLLVTVGITPAFISAQNDQRCFEETGFCISGRIREYWEQNGGLPIFGLPITPQRQELIEGQPLQVQWFERNRLELHPENQPPYDVLLGRLGVDVLQQQGQDWQSFAKSPPQDGCLYFADTGHNVCGEILEAWQSQGLEQDGVSGFSRAEHTALFGLPLSGVIEETLSDGQVYQVQYFERARFELHPENEPPYHVLLGLLGSLIGPSEVAPQSSTNEEIQADYIEVGKLTTYTHPSGIFSIDVPENWSVEETRSENVVTVTFTDPSFKSAVIVALFQASSPIENMETALQQSIQSGFSDKPDLQIGVPEQQSDGSVRVTFTYATTFQGRTIVMLGNSFMQQDGNIVSINWNLVPQSQFEQLQGTLDAISDSYQVYPSVPFP